MLGKSGQASFQCMLCFKESVAKDMKLVTRPTSECECRDNFLRWAWAVAESFLKVYAPLNTAEYIMDVNMQLPVPGRSQTLACAT